MDQGLTRSQHSHPLYQVSQRLQNTPLAVCGHISSPQIEQAISGILGDLVAISASSILKQETRHKSWSTVVLAHPLPTVPAHISLELQSMRKGMSGLPIR